MMKFEAQTDYILDSKSCEIKKKLELVKISKLKNQIKVSQPEKPFGKTFSHGFSSHCEIRWK